ncbi:MAG: glycoside hydrolase 43 family protein [Butyrivibrio sp.]|nr:glycoside hydrolase 43 family protein [Butyrivibrio sp.]
MKTQSDIGNTYKNPILFADYSDPDVIRVGDTFYMTASSFNYTPGLPILVSKDLVNWELKNYALKNIGQERFGVPRHSEGVWAPAIRYYDGMFYIYYGMPDEGYYVVRSKDPLGKWEEPVCVLEGKGLIDPCPFRDDDGKDYIIHGYAKSRIGFKSILGIFEMSSDGLRAVSEDHFIFDGNDPSHPAVTIEGPKVYKRNGYYYILAPAGGVKYGYQVALRSRDIRGPYELRTVMAQGNSVINGPHQGGLVDTPNGDEWFIHFQDRGLYGRICHLQPVCWKEEWPVIGSFSESAEKNSCGRASMDNLMGEPVYEYEMPDCSPVTKEASAKASDEGINKNIRENLTADPGGKELWQDTFADGKPDLAWQWLGDHNNSFYGKVAARNPYAGKEAEGGLRLFSLNPSGDAEPTLWRSANVLTKKIGSPVFSEEITLDAAELKSGERAGVCMMGGQYAAAYIAREDDGYYVCTARSEGGDADKKEKVLKRFRLSELCHKTGISEEQAASKLKFIMTFTYKDRDFDSRELYFRNVDDPMFGESPSLYIELQIEGGGPTDLGIKFTPSDHTWVGAKTGIYAISSAVSDVHRTGNPSSSGCTYGFADFKSVVTKEL